MLPCQILVNTCLYVSVNFHWINMCETGIIIYDKLGYHICLLYLHQLRNILEERVLYNNYDVFLYHKFGYYSHVYVIYHTVNISKSGYALVLGAN